VVGVCAAGEVLEHREVAHEGVGGRAVPVVFPGRVDDGVAGAHAEHRAVARADESDALGDVQGLADRMGVPVGAGARGEPDEGDGHPRRLLSAVDGSDVDVAGERLRWGLGGGAEGSKLHGSFSQRASVNWVSG
jgi:hypothetical protein